MAMNCFVMSWRYMSDSLANNSKDRPLLYGLASLHRYLVNAAQGIRTKAGVASVVTSLVPIEDARGLRSSAPPATVKRRSSSYRISTSMTGR